MKIENNYSRRTMFKAAGVGAATVAVGVSSTKFANVNAASVVSIKDFGGSPMLADNSDALINAIAAAGANGTVNIPGGVYKMSKDVRNTISTNIIGTGNSVTPTVLDYTSGSAVWGIAFNGGITGSVKNISFRGCSSAQIFIGGSSDVSIDSCKFYDPVLFGVQLDSAKLSVNNCITAGNAKNVGNAYYLGGATSVATINQSQITGMWRGIYAVGIDTLNVNNLTVNGLWWHLNKESYGSTLSSVNGTSFTMSNAVNGINNNSRNTVTVWEKTSNNVTVKPILGKAGWYALSGVSTVEPRLMISNNDMFGTIVNVDGNNAYIPMWFDWKEYHPAKQPTSTKTGFIAETPYIGVLASLNGTSGTVDAWRKGPTVQLVTPPANTRMQIDPPVDYQVFSTNQTKNFNVNGTTVYNSWTDSIASINSQNVSVTNSTIYDGQDVGLTMQLNTGTLVARNNTTYRQGTASIFIGTNNAIIDGNTSYGAQHISVVEDSYGAFQIEGAENVKVMNNTAVWGGAPYEDRGLLIEGRYGGYASVGRPDEAPYSYGGTYTNNKFVGYPSTLSHPVPGTEPGLKQVEVTIRGTKATAVNSSWAPGTRFQALDGASLSQIGQ